MSTEYSKDKLIEAAVQQYNVNKKNVVVKLSGTVVDYMRTLGFECYQVQELSYFFINTLAFNLHVAYLYSSTVPTNKRVNKA